jgi:hypothetical protein
MGAPAAATPAPRVARAAPKANLCAAPGARSTAAACRARGAPREGQRHRRHSVLRAPDKDQGLFNVRASTRLDNVVEFQIKEYIAYQWRSAVGYRSRLIDPGNRS